MAPRFLSLVSIYSIYLRRRFAAAGLFSDSINIDDNTKIQYWGPKQRTQKPALVLIHGFGPKSLWQWKWQVEFFSAEYDVYVPDLVFFGGSTTKSIERSEIFQAVCVGKLMEKLGVERYSLMGTSYGGMVAYRMAATWPDRIGKVVIASSGVNMRAADSEALLKRAKFESVEKLMLPERPDELRTLLSLVTHKPPPSFVPDFVFNDFIQTLYTENRKEKVELLKGLSLGRDETPNICPLQQDVLIVWGEYDQIFPLQMATQLQQLLGNKARLEVIKNASHVPQMEQTSEFNKIVHKFITA